MKTCREYIYCFENKSMPHLYKIGKTVRTPEERLREANLPSTFKPPTPYILTMAKRVRCATDAEKQIHNLLRDYRVHKRREFFSAPYHVIKRAFQRIKGDDYEVDKYEIEDILAKKIVNNTIYYKIFWKGYSITDATWEPMDRLIEDHCSEVIRSFEESAYFTEEW
ncbi:MAG: GIY-YIG nuclease family protein [Flavobacterium sp.]